MESILPHSSAEITTLSPRPARHRLMSGGSAAGGVFKSSLSLLRVLSLSVALSHRIDRGELVKDQTVLHQDVKREIKQNRWRMKQKKSYQTSIGGLS